MAQQGQDKTIDAAMELLLANGFDGLAEAVTVLMNSTMVAERSEYLGAAPYERSPERVGQVLDAAVLIACGVDADGRRKYTSGRSCPN